MMPPSETSAEYKVTNEAPIAPLPSWLDNMLKDKIEKKPSPTPTPEADSLPDPTSWDSDLAESLFGVGTHVISLERTSRKPTDRKLEEIKFYLSIIPPIDDHDEWLKVGFAIHLEVGEEGWTAFDEWSSQSDSYEEDGNRHRWERIKDDKTNNTTMEYLRARASDIAPEKVATFLASIVPAAREVRPTRDWFGSDYLDSPEEPISWLVRGILEDDVTAIVYGDGGVGKTSALLDLCLCVATGEPWLDSHVTQGAVIYIDEQNSKRKIKRRLNAIRRGHGSTDPLPFYGCSYGGFIFDKSNPADLNELDRKIKETDARLVVIDSLVNVRGQNDMNADDMERVVNGLRQIAASNGCVVILIHHENKSEKYSGSHTLKTEPDVLLQVSRNQGETNITFTPNKVRDGWDTPFGANAIIEKDEETGVVLSYRLEKADPGKRVKDGTGRGPTQLQIVEAFLRESDGMEVHTNEIAKATGIDPTRVGEKCRALEAFEKVENTNPDAPRKDGNLWKWIGKEQ